MTRNITKNDKIRILLNENTKLREENARLHELSNEELSKQIIKEIERYSDATDMLYKKYAELDKLKIKGRLGRWKYWCMKMKVWMKEKVGS